MRVYDMPAFRCSICHCELWVSQVRHSNDPSAVLYRFEHFSTGSDCDNRGIYFFWNPEHRIIEV